MRRATFWLGAGLILACETLLLVDVDARGVAVLAPANVSAATPAEGVLGHLARWVAVHMTPLCWVGYLLLFDGLLAGGAGSPARLRPRRFWTCFVTSVFVWCFFDWVNFSFIHAWQYLGLERLSVVNVLAAKLVAFGAISPAMFLAAELYRRAGLDTLRTRGLPLGPPVQVAMVVVGLPAFLSPFWLRDPVACFPLWVSMVLLLDPINHWLARDRRRTPSLLADWQAGRWGRTIALMLAGLTCGVLWEFWNYWAGAKWVYTLPFLGPLEQYRLFEMPLPGFAGFMPFALECWVAFNTILIVMDRLGLRFWEGLPGDEVV